MESEVYMSTITAGTEGLDALRVRLNAYKSDSGLSWAQIAERSGIAAGTLSPWAAGKYTGDNARFGEEVRRFLDGQAALDRLKTGLVGDPGFLLTPTAERLLSILRWAHKGNIVAAACAPGVGKTMSATEYRRQAANVWIATMRPSCGGLQPMLLRVGTALGLDDRLRGSPTQLSQTICDEMNGRRGLLIIDEAQELGERSLDEIRSWNDECNVGVALFGDERVIGRLAGRKSVELARLRSRVSMRHAQGHPAAQDVEMVARGWGVSCPKQLKYLAGLAKNPGGLRDVAKVIELAGFLSADEDRPLDLADLQTAWSCRDTGVRS